MLECGWPGLFRHHILPSIPVNKVSKHFSETFGRPTKELYSMLGALIQQAFDLTDKETVQQYAFYIQGHYSLNITEESDSAKYISLKTLWNSRNIVASNKLEEDIFNAGTQKLAQVFEVNIDKQRIDLVHIKSNMRRLGRIGIFSESIHTFLVNMKRGHQSQFDTIDEKVPINIFPTTPWDVSQRLSHLNRRRRSQKSAKICLAWCSILRTALKWRPCIVTKCLKGF